MLRKLLFFFYFKYNFPLAKCLIQHGATAVNGRAGNENALHILMKNNEKVDISLLELYPEVHFFFFQEVTFPNVFETNERF